VPGLPSGRGNVSGDRLRPLADAPVGALQQVHADSAGAFAVGVPGAAALVSQETGIEPERVPLRPGLH